MAKNSTTVQVFEQDIARKVIQEAYNDYLELQDVKRKELKDPNAILRPWDSSYFGRIRL